MTGSEQRSHQRSIHAPLQGSYPVRNMKVVGMQFNLWTCKAAVVESRGLISVSNPVCSSGSESNFFLSLDPDRPKVRIRIHAKKVQKLQEQVGKKIISYLAFSTFSSFLVRGLQNLIKNIIYCRSHKFVNRQIRIQTLKTRIGEKTWIHPDPKHWI